MGCRRLLIKLEVYTFILDRLLSYCCRISSTPATTSTHHLEESWLAIRRSWPLLFLMARCRVLSRISIFEAAIFYRD